MASNEITAKMEIESNVSSFQKRVAPLLVLLFSSMVLWPLGTINFLTVIILLNISLAYPLLRMIDRKSIEEFGIKFHDSKKAIKDNWFLIISPIVVVKPLDILIQWVYPALSEHIMNRVPINLSGNPFIIFPVVVIIGPLLEEALFRGFLQRYTTFFAPKTLAIIFASIVFALFHYAPGDVVAVVLDFIFIFIRGCIYGLVYVRTENALISFLPHALVNLPL